MKIQKQLSLIIVSCLLLIFTGCQTNSMQVTTKQLEKYIWQLQSIDGQNVLAGSKITLQISDDKINGTGGANRYFAGWNYAEGSIEIAAIATTKRMMIEPKGVMSQEQRFFELLQSMQQVDIQEQVLIFTNSSGQKLEFIPQPEI